MPKNIIITGSNGFIAINLVNYLINQSKKNIIIGIDNRNNIKLNKNLDFFIKDDLSKFNNKLVNKILKLINVKDDIIFWHLAANSDIQKGSKNKSIDYKDTFLTSKNSLKYSLKLNSKKFIFASSSAVFGNSAIKLNESSINLKPISNYGIFKLKSEKLIFTYSKKNSDTLFYIFRLPNVVGQNLTHGIIFDFLNKLKANKNILNVLGDGTQTKPYIYITDLISAFLLILKNSNKKCNLFHIGPFDDGISVKDIVNIFISKFENNFLVTYEKKNIGWVGDVNKYQYNLYKIKSINWKPKYSSYQAIKKTVNFYLK